MEKRSQERLREAKNEAKRGLGGVLRALGDILGTSWGYWRVLEGAWGDLGRLLGGSWEGLGSSWEDFGRVLGGLGGALRGSGVVLRGVREVFLEP